MNKRDVCQMLKRWSLLYFQILTAIIILISCKKTVLAETNALEIVNQRDFEIPSYLKFTPVGLDKDNKITMGVYSARTHSIIPTKKCYIQNEMCQEIANDIFEFAREGDI